MNPFRIYRCLFAFVILSTLFARQSAQAQCCNAQPSSFTQPDGTVIEVHFHGNERYTRTVSADGYSLVFDHAAKAYFYANLDPSGNAFVSTGRLAKQAKPADLSIGKDLQLNPEARRKLAEKRGAELELVRKDREQWQAQQKKVEEVLTWREQQAAKRKNPGGSDPSNPDSTSSNEGGTGTTDPGVTGPELAPPTNPPTLGDVLGLTILVDFSDVPARSDVTRADYDDYLNKPGGRAGWGNKGSVYDYFYAQSNGRLRYRNNVTYYVRLPNPYSYYNDTSVAQNSGTNGRKLLTDALNQLIAEGYDFSGLTANASNGRVIAANLLWAGNSSGVWASGLWPHRWVLSTPLNVGGGLYIYDYQCTNIGASGNPTIGTFCHENGHMVGKYPDYYDTNGGSEGVGNHCLMGAGNNATGTNPTNISSYLKMHSGWMDVVNLESFNASKPIRLSASVDSSIVYKYSTGAMANEYFLIENRSKIGGWESTSGLPDSGLMFSHVHHTGNNQNEQRSESLHYEHSIEQADGLFQLETAANRGNNGDYFHADGTDGPMTEFSDTTLPNAKWWTGAVAGDNTSGTNSGLHIHSIGNKGAVMTFVYGAGTPSAAASTRLTTSILENAADYSTTATSQSFSIYNTGGGTLTYNVSDNVSWLACNVASGTATTEADAVTVTYTTSGLAAGTYNGTITVDGGTAGIQTIAVTLTIRNQPFIVLNPTSLSIPGISGLSGYRDEFDIKNTGGGSAAYTISKTQSWLSILPASGTVGSERDTITVTCSAVGLAAGTYNDTITVTCPSASNGPLTIPISFVVGGTDMILTAPDGGENWLLNTTREITWASSLGGNVKIELLKNGVLNTTIAETTPNDGSYSWTVPGGQTPGADYKIKVTSVESPTKSDTSFSNFSISEDQLALALDTTGLIWSTSSSIPWFRQTTTTKDAVDAAQCANITHAENTTMETTIVGPGTMTFWWQVSSESGYDFLRFYLNGVEQTGSLARISGNVAWVQKTVTIPIGSNVVKWGYDKDGSVDGGTLAGVAADTAWVDQVVYTPSAAPEIAVEDNGGAGLTDGTSTYDFGSVNTGSNLVRTFTIRNVGTSDLTGIAISKSGTNSADYTLSTLSTNLLAPNASTTFTVTFAPGAAGTRTALLQIASDDANENPFDINLTGTGVGPGTLSVTGAGGLTSSGNYNSSSYTPSSIQYTLTNTGNTSINWTAAKTKSWVTLSSSGGTLAPSASTTVTVSIDTTAANALNAGSHTDTVTFTNTSNSNGNTTRAVSLTVNSIAATVSLSNLLQYFDGSQKPVTVTTTPGGLTHTVTYNGSATVPSAAGSYPVVVTVTQPNYTGSASGTLNIAYNVTYNGNVNTGGSVPTAQTKYLNVDLTLDANSGSLSKTGYTLIGWNTSADGSGTSYAVGSTYSANASVILYAQWIAGTYLTWDANGTGAGQTNGAGSWEGANLWWNGTANQGWQSGASATFGGLNTAGGAVTLAAPTSLNSIIFNQFTGTYTLGAAAQTITINSGIDKTAASAAVTFLSPISLGGNQIWTNNSTGLLLTGSGTNLITNNGYQLTVDGTGSTTFGVVNNSGVTLSGSGALVKNGSGRFNLGGINSAFTGNVTINGGVLQGYNDPGVLGGGNLRLSGGVLSFYWGTTYTRALGNAAGEAQLTSGDSGFGGAGTSSPTINLGTIVVWGASGQGTATGFFNPSKFVLGDAGTTNAGVVSFSSNIDFNGVTRTIVVPKGLSAGGNVSTISGAITSTVAAGLIKEGDGTLVLSAANTYTGNTTISGGNLRIGNNTAGSLNSGNYAGNISIASGATLQIWSTTAQTLSGVISGSGGLNKAYGGTLTLSGPYTYTGRTSFLPQTTTGFTVNISSFNSVNGGTPAMPNSSLGAPTTIANGTIDIGDTGKQANVNLTYTGTGETTDRVLNFGFNGTSSQTLTASGTGLLKFTSAMTVNTLTTQSGALILTGTGSGEITQTLPALPTGGLTKNGNGTWTLGGANSYTGLTTITAGKLFINGNQTLATGNVSVSANATLGGTGTIGGHTTIATGGKLEFNISTSDASHDGLAIATGKDFTFSGTSTLTINSSGGAAPGTYTLITGGNSIIGSAPSTLVLPSGWVASVSISGNSLQLIVTSTGGGGTGSLAVTSADGLSSSGYTGGPFLPGSITYTLSNPGSDGIAWTATKTVAWLDVTAAGTTNITNGISGTLASGASVQVTVAINSAANSLVANSYNDLVTFTNITNGTGNTTRAVALTATARPTYTVTYNGNSNSGGSVPSIQTKTHDIGLVLSAQGSLVRTGYTFAGWNTAADGSGATYAPGATYTDNASITLYANWTANTYTVNFNANGGDAPSIPSISVTYGSTYGALATITRTGYTFNGWFTASSGGTLITSASTVAITTAQPLYAQWTINSYTITFSSAGGSAVTPITQNYNTAVTTPAAPTRTGYTFAGWSPTVPATMPANNLTVTAQWTANNYTVTFDANGGGTPSTPSISVTYGSTYGTLATITRTGYTFNGWYTASSGGALITSASTVAITVAQPLYAQWTVNSYTITFSSAGGSAVSPITQNYDTAVTTPAAPTRTGYAFAGWSPAVPATMPANNLTVTAQWTANTYTVNFVANGGEAPSMTSKSVTYDSTYGALATTTRTGYGFTGWFTATQGGDWVDASSIVSTASNHTLYAQWIQIAPEIDISRDSVSIASGGYDAVSATTAAVETKLTYALTNSGNADLTLTNAVISALNNCTATIDSQPASTVTPYQSGVGMLLGVIPTASGAWSFRVTIANNDPNENPYQWTVHGVTASSATVSLTSVADTYIDAASPAANNGGATSFSIFNRVSGPNSAHRYGLLKFDLSLGASGIPANATITTASIGLVQSNNKAGLVDIVNVTNTWTEATTWASAATNLVGSTSYGSESSTVTTNSSVPSIVLNDTGLNIVRSWHSTPGTNYGVGVKTTNNASNANIDLHSREATNAAYRPKLNVSYTVNPQVSEMAIVRQGSTVLDGSTDSVSETVAGQASQLTYVIANLGNSNLTLTTPVSVSSATNCSVSVVNQPANTVAASAETVLVLNVTPAAAGAWSVNLSIANNDADEATYNWTISGTAMNRFTSWASTSGLTGDDAALTSNPDGDSLTNLQEFAFGMSPTLSNMSPLAFNAGGEVTQAGIPILRFATAKYHAVFARRKDHVAAGLIYTAAFSADLKVWTPSAAGLSVLTGAGSSELEAVSIEFPSTVPVDGGGTQQPPKFFRVGVQ